MSWALILIPEIQIMKYDEKQRGRNRFGLIHDGGAKIVIIASCPVVFVIFMVFAFMRSPLPHCFRAHQGDDSPARLNKIFLMLGRITRTP